MLSREEATDAVGRRLSTAAAVGGGGGHVFELADGMRLGIDGLPDGRLVAWSEVSPPPETADAVADNENRAADLLRMHLARLGRATPFRATRDDGGALLLFVVYLPADAEDWLKTVAALLDETEVLRRRLEAPSGAGRHSESGLGGLFSAGMSGFLSGR